MIDEEDFKPPVVVVDVDEDPALEDIQYPRRKAYKFDDDAMQRFLRSYMKTGQVYASCRAAGVSEETIRKYTRDNINGFADMYEEVRGMYRDQIEQEIMRRAIHGIDEPIIGGKDRDEVVVYVKRYSDRLLELMARRHIPEYREKQQLDVNVSGGVMVIPSRPATQGDWSEQYGSIPRPTDEKKAD